MEAFLLRPKKMQTKLDSFFRSSAPKKLSSKKYFVYDPENKVAFFTTTVIAADKFINTKCKVQLYYRAPNVPVDPDIPLASQITPIQYHVPLLKSNLQKAVRRKETLIALQTSILLMEQDMTQFLRRLPIICIEDVCALNTLPIMVWLMMADKDYRLTTHDKDIILNIIWTLCNTDNYFQNIECKVEDREFTHEQLETHEPASDCLLALFYRAQYGGMGGDMAMLGNAVCFYDNNPDEIVATSYGRVDYDAVVSVGYRILIEAVDFHCYPPILKYVAKNMEGLAETEVKEMIWFAESGPNVRKKATMKSAEYYRKLMRWPIVKKYADEYRLKMLRGQEVVV